MSRPATTSLQAGVEVHEHRLQETITSRGSSAAPIHRAENPRSDNPVVALRRDARP